MTLELVVHHCIIDQVRQQHGGIAGVAGGKSRRWRGAGQATWQRCPVRNVYAMIGSGITCRKNARKGKSRTHGKAAHPGHRRVRCRSPAQPHRRPLETAAAVPPVRRQGAALLGPGTADSAISQKMLAQQLRQLERDGLVLRTVYAQVPPQVDYRLTPWGQALCPALDAMLTWGQARQLLHEPSPQS